MKKDYLPIGSVVLLKNGKKRVMVCGYYVKTNLETDEVYDYVGVLYPEGLVSSTENIVFNHEQIDKVFFIGYQDKEESKFRKKITNK